MATNSVVLVSPQGNETTVSSAFEFNVLVFTQGYKPKTGTIQSNFDYLVGAGTTPTPDPTAHVTATDVANGLKDPTSVIGTAGRAASGSVAAVVTAAGSLVVQKHNPVDATTGPLTMTLPTGAPEGSQLSVEKADSTTNLVTVTGNIRGSNGSISLAYLRETVQFRADASGSWFPVAGHRTKASLEAAFISALSAELFGAKGDGVADDTAALVSAIQAASTAKRPLVLTGVYRFTTIGLTLDDVTIEWRPGASLLCTQSKTANVVPVRITGSRVRLISPTMTYTTPVDIDVDSQARPADADSFRLGGASASAPADDITVSGGKVLHSRNTGVRVRYATRVRLDRVVVDEALGNGIMLDTCQDSSVTFCRTRRTGDDGIAILAADVDYAAFRSRNNTAVGNHVTKSYANGINFTGVDGGLIASNLIEDTWAPGIRVWRDTTFQLGPCNDVTISPNTIRRPGRYFGPGQFKTAAMSVPVGVYCVGGVKNVVLHPQTVSGAQGDDVQIIGGGVVDLRPSVNTMRQVAGQYVTTVGVAAQTVTATQSLLTWIPIVLIARFTTRNLSVNVTTGVAGATVRVGIYADAGGVPGPLIAEADAVIDASTTGLKSATVVTTLDAGSYWLGAVAQGGAPGVRAVSGKAPGIPASQDPGSSLNGWSQTGVTAALPASAGINGGTPSATAITLGI